MSHKERIAYLEAIRKRYRRSSRKNKKLILDEFCVVCGFNRKYAIRILNQPSACIKRKRGRKSRYCDPWFLRALLNIWKATDYMCSSRLKAVIPVWLPCYENSFEPLADDIRSLLLNISRATLDRVLRPLGSLRPRHVRDQALDHAAQPDPYTHQQLGYHTTRLHGGRYGSSLRQQPCR